MVVALRLTQSAGDESGDAAVRRRVAAPVSAVPRSRRNPPQPVDFDLLALLYREAAGGRDARTPIELAFMPDEPQQRYSELASFGEELRREREIRSISLKEISDATKISKRFLEAIERNDHRTLPAPVFTRGFVREYARYLGLSAEEIVNRYNFAAAGDDRIEQSTHLDRLVQPQALPLPRDREQIRDRK